MARGPGSVAYGSDAFGGVISVRTRRVVPGSPLAVQFSGTVGAGIPNGAARSKSSKGLPAGGVLFAAHARDADDWDSPEGEVFNSGFSDHGFLVRVEQKVGAGYLTRRLAERLRPRHRTAAQQLAHGAVLLSERGLASLHDRIRSPQRRRASSASGSPGSSAATISAPIRIASRPPPPAAPSSAPTSRPTTSTSAASANSSLGKSRARVRRRRQRPLRPERDRRSDHTTTWRATSSARGPTSRSTPRSRTDTGVYASDRQRGGAAARRSAAASAATTSRPRTPAATSAIARPATAPARGTRRRPSAASAASA